MILYGWQQLCGRIAEYREALEAFFPTLVPAPPSAIVFVGGDGRPAPRAVLPVDDTLTIPLNDLELALFCSETAALLKLDPEAVLQVEQAGDARIRSQISKIDALAAPSLDERTNRAHLRGLLDSTVPKLRRLSVAVRILLTDQNARSPWLVGPDLERTAEVLRRLVKEVLAPPATGRPGFVAFKIRAPQDSRIIGWVDLSDAEMPEFLARNPSFSPHFFLGNVADLGSTLGLRHALPAGIAAIARFSDSFEVPLDHLRPKGATAIYVWALELA